MGSRGASSNKGKYKYGTEYRALLTHGNIKFVQYRKGDSAKTPMETQTKGRVYVTVNKDEELSAITYYDKDGKRNRQIDLKHSHRDIKGEHVHMGYEHDENGTRNVTDKEKRMIERVYEIWYNRNK